MLEATQKSSLDITEWLIWFLECLRRAFNGAETTLHAVLHKAEFWKKHQETTFNSRQRDMLNRLLDDTFFGNLTSSKWAKIEKCSQDTASRDINDLVERGLLRREAAGRNTNYSLVDDV
jgi:Fic family protein